ncbi:CPCC family cysteine-rich protein [Psychrobacter sp. I-STPA10]|uniref:CPCC family cysteine-rich protein n=1 Tax=Psychrobacter sp. I-STPA10 TaxID=2585769 RepID=UPI001E340D57|nr:CPCC family cysteine-rich protein [Psychrobacter sp. I-STPA10]
MQQILRLQVFQTIAEFKIRCLSYEQLIDTVDVELSQDNLQVQLADYLSDIYAGVSNGYLASLYGILTDRRVEVVGDVADLFACPCCGYKTLTEIYDPKRGTGYDICHYCHWEDDGTTDANQQSSVNRGSISDYRVEMTIKPNFYYQKMWYCEK